MEELEHDIHAKLRTMAAMLEEKKRLRRAMIDEAEYESRCCLKLFVGVLVGALAWFCCYLGFICWMASVVRDGARR
jgi:hypothetical protein